MIAFVHIEKSGGKTIARILRREFGLRHCDVHSWTGRPVFTADDYRRLSRLYWNLKSISGHSVRPYSNLRDVCPDLEYFSMFRNPIQRCAAQFNYHKVVMRKTVSFEEWIDTPRYRNRATHFLSGTDNADAAIARVKSEFKWVGITELFDESMLLLQAAIGKETFSAKYPVYGHARTNWLTRTLLGDPLYKRAPPDQLARKLLDCDKALTRLEAANHSDLRLFEYVRSEVFPGQVRRYGQDFGKDLEEFRGSNHPPIFSWNWTMNRLKRQFIYKPAVATYSFLANRSAKGSNRSETFGPQSEW